MQQNYRLVSYNLGNGTNICPKEKKADSKTPNLVLNRRQIKNTTSQQIELLKQLEPDFIVLQELTRLTPMNLFVNTEQIFSNEFSEYYYQYFANLYQFKGLLEHGKANIISHKFNHNFNNHQISRDCDDYELFRKMRDNKEISLLKELFLKLNAFILNNRSLIESTVKLNSGTLKIFNAHLIPLAYNQDKRIEELRKIIQILVKELKTGNHVILGGDFNFNLRPKGQVDDFPSELKKELENNGLNLIIPQQQTHKLISKDKNGNPIFSVLDGFITSETIDVMNVKSTGNFELCDHCPIILDFKIK